MNDPYRECWLFREKVSEFNAQNPQIQLFLTEDLDGALVQIHVRYAKHDFRYLEGSWFKEVRRRCCLESREAAVITSDAALARSGMIDISVNLLQKGMSYARLWNALRALCDDLAAQKKKTHSRAPH